MQKAKTLFDKLAAVNRPISLKDFNLYLFCGLQGEFKDLVRSLVTKTEPLLYAKLHSYFLTREFLHKTSLHFIGCCTTPLLSMSAQPPSAHGAQHQPSGSYNNNYNFSCGRGRSHGG